MSGFALPDKSFDEIFNAATEASVDELGSAPTESAPAAETKPEPAREAVKPAPTPRRESVPTSAPPKVEDPFLLPDEPEAKEPQSDLSQMDLDLDGIGDGGLSDFDSLLNLGDEPDNSPPVTDISNIGPGFDLPVEDDAQAGLTVDAFYADDQNTQSFIPEPQEQVNERPTRRSMRNRYIEPIVEPEAEEPSTEETQPEPQVREEPEPQISFIPEPVLPSTPVRRPEPAVQSAPEPTQPKVVQEPTPEPVVEVVSDVHEPVETAATQIATPEPVVAVEEVASSVEPAAINTDTGAFNIPEIAVERIVATLDALRKLDDKSKKLANLFITDGNPVEGESALVLAAIQRDRQLLKTMGALIEARAADQVDRAFFILSLDERTFAELGEAVAAANPQYEIKVSENRLNYARSLVDAIESLTDDSMVPVSATVSLLEAGELRS